MYKTDKDPALVEHTIQLMNMGGRGIIQQKTGSEKENIFY